MYYFWKNSAARIANIATSITIYSVGAKRGKKKRIEQLVCRNVSEHSQDVNSSGTTITRTDASALPDTRRFDDALNVSSVGGKS